MNDVIKDISLAGTVGEVIEARDVNSKTFTRVGGGFRKIVTLGVPIHYRDINSNLQDIEFAASRDGLNNYVVDKAPYVLKVDPTLPAYDYTGEGGEVSVELIKVGTGQFRPSALVQSGNIYTWLVGTDTSYAITPLPFGVRTDLSLSSSKAPKTWQWRIIGNAAMLQPVTGKDATGRICEITQSITNGVLTATWSGRTATQRDLRRTPSTAWTNTATYPVTIDPVVNEAISANADDGQSFFGGTAGTGQTLTGTQIGAGHFGYPDYTQHVTGLRFQTVAVPQGATINSATLTVNVIGITGTSSTRWYADDVDNAAGWATTSRIKNITKTTAFTAFAPASTGSKNIDVTSIIQELVNRAGWASNNNMRLACFAQGAGTHEARMEALENAGTAHATLSIDYTAAAAGAAWFQRQRTFTGGFNKGMTGGFDG